MSIINIRKWLYSLPALSTHHCKLALHGLAAYLLNSLQRCSSLQSRRKQRWRPLVLVLCKITK